MDHGLRYELAAVLGRPAVLQTLARALGRGTVVPLEAVGIGLLPITADVARAATAAAMCAFAPSGPDPLPGGSAGAVVRRVALLSGPESGFDRMTPGLAALVEAASVPDRLAYVEADYMARDGRQSSAVWREGRLVTGPLLLGPTEQFVARDAPIAVALRALGVMARGRRDGFLVAGLDRFRSTEDWCRQGGR
ncbi:hypothetical protein [Pseudonocardia endophytica]|uniref:Uncharacterized protein n=1 Tax=Pseudonocardia endophytica TaxID=401976 RepID=A0A4R1HQD7_PSEEN|nr:hypothetical protein [Pseudonocardia endophytica]TCK24804.1 hypothetical protein EV378_0597 [Pseudonocardia endophytica]